MPSKKKVVPQTSPNQHFLKPGLEAIPSGCPKKIPRKPLFRYVDYDNFSRAQHIRVKFWKSYSCALSELPSGSIASWVLDSFRGGIENKKKTEKTFKHSTIKKSLKSTKKFQFCSFFLSENQYLLKLCRSWKLDTLKTSFLPQYNSQRILKPFMNSKLKMFPDFSS